MFTDQLFQASLSILAGVVVALLSGYFAQLNERQWWLKEEIYRPLYNEVDQIASEGSLGARTRFTSEWYGFDEYQRYRVDSKLQKEIEKYLNLLRQFNSLDAGIKDYDKFMASLPEEMTHYSDGNGWQLDFDGTRMSSMWFSEMGDLVYIADDSIEMRELIDQRRPSIHSPSNENLRAWDEQVPHWPETVRAALKNSKFGLTDDAEELSRLKNEEIPDQAVEIRSELQKRIDGGLLSAFIHNRN